MVIVALFGASLPMITFAIGIVSWTAVARITRAEFLRIRELEYVMASRASGVPNRKLMFRCDPAQRPAADHRAVGADGGQRHPVRGRVCPSWA